MADPYFNPHTLYADFQNAYKSVMSRCDLVLNDCPQQSGVAFGLQVQQTAPNNQLNRSILNGENVHNPFNYSRFKQVPVRVIYHQEAGQTEPLELSVKPKSQQTEESAQFHTGQLKLRIDQVWSMASEEIIDDNTPFFDRERERYHEKVQDPEKRKLRNQRERERRADPEKRKLINQRKRERYHEKVQDPEKRKLINQRKRECYHEKVQDPEKRKLINQRQRERLADPEKRKLRNQRQRERYHEKVQDPEKRKLINQRQRERLADPEKRKLINQRQRERRADPEKRKLRNQRQRERYHEKVQDPEKRKLINQRQRERLADPEKRKLRNQRQQALPAISPSGDISQLSYITEATPTSSTN